LKYPGHTLVKFTYTNFLQWRVRHVRAPFSLPLSTQPGDVRETCADVEDLQKAVGFSPEAPIAVGIQKFVDWFCAFHGV
jgi:nucleoside-diphosphate-sugar epimerase